MRKLEGSLLIAGLFGLGLIVSQIDNGKLAEKLEKLRPKPKKEEGFVFDGRNYIDYVIDFRPIDYNGDFDPDAYLVAYDLNENGIKDHVAKYESYVDSLNQKKFFYNPSEFYHDENEDGTPEYRHLDLDGDGVMETTETNPDLESGDRKRI